MSYCLSFGRTIRGSSQLLQTLENCLLCFHHFALKFFTINFQQCLLKRTLPFRVSHGVHRILPWLRGVTGEVAWRHSPTPPSSSFQIMNVPVKSGVYCRRRGI